MSMGNTNHKGWPQAQAPKTDAEKMKDLIAQFQDFEDLIGIASPKNRAVQSFDQEIDNVKNKIKHYTESLAKLEKAKEFYDGLPFRLGDAAFHKDHGNVLIKSITVNQEDLEDSHYVIVGIDKQYKVPIKELVPINEATKALFGRKK